jgi:hypothetical protein
VPEAAAPAFIREVVDRSARHWNALYPINVLGARDALCARVKDLHKK